MTTLKKPGVPFLYTLPGGAAQSGQKFVIKGKPHDSANRFRVDFLQNETQMKLFHLDFRFDQDCTVRNTNFPSGEWGTEDRGSLPVQQGKKFKLELKIEGSCIRVEIDGDHHCDWHFRAPNSIADTLQIRGDVDIDSVKFL